MNSSQVLLLPGWQNSGPDHWQTRWETLHGFKRVEQHDWMRPLRGDWNARLEEVLLSQAEPVLLAAHSLGCLLAAAWAAHSRQTARVRGALLVAPPDLEREDLRPLLPGWTPIERQRLPFPAIVVASSNDGFGSVERAQTLAGDWGAGFVCVGERGHVNAESGLGDWPEGLSLLRSLDRP
ncbi:MAG: serine hydrolase family protein [Curvibacter sp.]|nr:serine hydrolase family protein [Curvibacter sp.]